MSKSILKIAAVFCFVFLIAAQTRAEDAKTDDGFKPMFNGKDLDGWEGRTDLWFVENGEIVGKSPGIKKNEFLASTASYKDFVVTLKFKLVDLSDGKSGMINSGVQFRSVRVPKNTEMSGYQADIGAGWYGTLYDESRRNKPLAKPTPEILKSALKENDWNDYKITCEGAHIKLELNGVVTVDYTETETPEKAPRDGKFGLQIHAGGKMEIHFKNVMIKVIEK